MELSEKVREPQLGAHSLKLTPGHVDRFGQVEKPWKCVNCGKYFSRRTDAKTCKRFQIEENQ